MNSSVHSNEWESDTPTSRDDHDAPYTLDDLLIRKDEDDDAASPSLGWEEGQDDGG